MNVSQFGYLHTKSLNAHHSDELPHLHIFRGATLPCQDLNADVEVLTTNRQFGAWHLFHTLRLAISLGGDADTQGAIAGAVAEAYWGGQPEDIETEVNRILPSTDRSEDP